MVEDHPVFQLKDVANRMDHTRFYADHKFGLLIDLRSMVDKTMHGSGARLVNTKDDVFLEIDKEVWLGKYEMPRFYNKQSSEEHDGQTA